MAPPPQQQQESYGGRKPGSISDYDPTTGRGHEGSPYTNKTQSTTVYSSSASSQQQGELLQDVWDVSLRYGISSILG